MQIRSVDQEDPLKKEIATHSSILAWEILWTEKPGRVQSTGLQSIGHNGAYTHTGFQLYLKSRKKKNFIFYLKSSQTSPVLWECPIAINWWQLLTYC